MIVITTSTNKKYLTTAQLARRLIRRLAISETKRGPVRIEAGQAVFFADRLDTPIANRSKIAIYTADGRRIV